MLRFNHMEITVPLGTVAQNGAAFHEFMKDAFGFEAGEFPAKLEHPGLVVTDGVEGGQFLFIAEHPQSLPKASDDHLGFHVDSAEEVDRILQICEDWQKRDERVEIRDFGLVDFGRWETRAVYVRFILPIWFDVQNIAPKAP